MKLTSINGLSKKLTSCLPAISIAILIFYLSSLESIELPLDEISFNDLAFHFMGYSVFGLSLLVAAYPWSKRKPYPFPTVAILILIGVCYAASDEIHQLFVPNRSGTIIDFLADSSGIVTSILIGNKLIGKKIAFLN